MFDRAGGTHAGLVTRAALVMGGAAVACMVVACSDAAAPKRLPPPPPDEVPAPPAPICPTLQHICAVPLQTYDSSGELVHPDIATFPGAFAGHAFWLAATPYPNGNASFENPSIFTDRAGRWGIPNGLTNPVVPAPGLPAHNSDPDIVYDPVGRVLRLYYRLTQDNQDQVLMRSSTDGVRWSDPRSLAAAPGISIVSPAIVRLPGGQWIMWSVNAVNGGCVATSAVLERRTSADGLQWSSATPVTIDQPGYVIWHLDVQYIPERNAYWALIAAYPRGAGCAADDLFFASSADGLTWQTYASPIVARGDYAAFHNAVYRSTFEYDAEHDALRLWLSGAVFRDGSWFWTMATSRWRRTDLLMHVMAANAGAPPAASNPAVFDGTTPASSQSEFP
jgi:hypothetical protein